MKLQQLALFPLPSPFCPVASSLRLFEPRHLQMLKESFLEDRGFGIVMKRPPARAPADGFSLVGTASG